MLDLGKTTMYTIIRSPWENIFLEQLKNAKKNIYLASPFIKLQTAKTIAANCRKSLDVRFISSFKLANFYRGASDLDALRVFNTNRVRQKSVHNLHAKFFVFDKTAIITSGNLTPGGLKNNIEYGIMLKDSLVETIRKDYLDIFNNPDNPTITDKIISKANEILNSTPKERLPNIKIRDESLLQDILNDHNIDERYSGGVESIIQNLSSWKRDVFECLLKLPNDVFSLDELYVFEDCLMKLHPDNRNVKPKIRQQLQYLRDLGLVEFLTPGTYKKLWV